MTLENVLEQAREIVKTLEEMKKHEAVPCNNKVLLSDIPVGGIVEEGGIRFIVLEHFESGSTEIISERFMLENIKFGDSRNYKGSNLERQITEKCLPVFEKTFGKENLVYHDTEMTSIDMQNEFGSFNAAVRPLTFDEARKYNDLISNENLYGCTWTCTPWSTKKRGWKYSIAVVAPSGDFYNSRCEYSYSYGVRPVCILKSNIFVSKGE